MSLFCYTVFHGDSPLFNRYNLNKMIQDNANQQRKLIHQMYIKLMLSQPLFMVEIEDEVTLFTTWVDGVKKLRIDLTPAS